MEEQDLDSGTGLCMVSAFGFWVLDLLTLRKDGAQDQDEQIGRLSFMACRAGRNSDRIMELPEHIVSIDGTYCLHGFGGHISMQCQRITCFEYLPVGFSSRRWPFLVT